MDRIFLRFPGGKPKALTFSHDDGVTQDERLISIFKKNNLKGTFNLNSSAFGLTYNAFQTILTAEKVANLYSDAGMEVAVHAYSHDFLQKLQRQRIMHELFMDRCKIEEVTKTVVRGCAYPWGTYNKDVEEVAKEAGLAYCRTTGTTGSFPIPTNWYEFHPTCHQNNEHIFEYIDRFVNQSPNNEQYDKDPWLFYIWGHSYEFDARGDWDHIEKVCESLANKEDVWYCTNIEAYDYIEAYRNLQFSADGTIVHNQFAIDIWVHQGDKDICIPAGKTISLA